MKFGKEIQRRAIDLPEYAAHFLNYKSLKKVRLDEGHIVNEALTGFSSSSS